MKKILVSGLVNIETSLSVDSFPINYSPVEYPFFGVNSFVSGVGYNVAKALKTLGDDVSLLTEIGDDMFGTVIKEELKKNQIDDTHAIVFPSKETATSVVLVDKNGQRKIYCDLKDIQDREPLKEDVINLDDYSLLALTNINFNRELIKIAHAKGLKVATDVHVLSNIYDSYNKDFILNSDILFLSNEAIIGKEADFIKEIYHVSKNSLIICGLGAQGALLYEGKNDKYIFQEAIAPLGVKSTVGAGDALFSAFIHFYNKELSLEECLRRAVIFAGLKISEQGGSNGFVNEEELNKYL